MQDETRSQFQQRIFDRYFDSLVRYAEARLGRRNRRVADGEDVALSALGSFYERYGETSIRAIGSEDSLWPLIVTIVHRKTLNQARREAQLKRGGGDVRGDSVLSELPVKAEVRWDSTPDAVVESLETVNRLLSSLPPDLAEIANRRLEGHTNAEIAALIGCSVATIERRLKLIRSIWAQAIV
ncbi:RNA polymerase sigma factor [Stieleria maiorica]|uniref:RNA polymerase sigma factor n=1 Tax=Stieleria maiorica TaxID=2795974 RepID=A0A5B9MG04_9BACT|nr:RNA polymerase sigma factor [Stieleria maiorica]